jgi:ribosomal protein S18 acetylase RimI-like enzyme
MKIRLLTTEDYKVWKAIRLEALQNSPESFGSSYEEEISSSVEDCSAQKNDIFGAFIEEKLVATTGFIILKMEKMKHRGVLFAIYVTPKHRGQGIASQLIETAINHAKSRVIQLHLTCTTTNESALNLYQKHGFKTYGTEPRSLKIDDNFFDEYLMLLEFNK